MRILVTGAAGFIGSHLCERFDVDGHEVAGVDNFLTGTNNRDDINEVDIVDRHALYKVANAVEPELVVHCAASYSDPNLWHRDAETNVLGTINATLVAKHHGARILYFNTALPPISSYAISKIAGQQYIEQSGVEHIIFRLANIYGPRNLSGPIPTFFKRITAGQECTVVKTKRDMVYIDDLVAAVVSAVCRGAEGVFDICSGTDYSIATLYEQVSYALDIRKPAKQVQAGDDDVTSMVLDPSRAFTQLQWFPKVPLRIGVDAAVSWYAANGVGETYTHLRLK